MKMSNNPARYEVLVKQSLIRGGSAQRSNPLLFDIPLWQKKVPLLYTFYLKKGTSFANLPVTPSYG